MPWNARFLLVPFTCFALALTLLSDGQDLFKRGMRWTILAIGVFSAITYPLMSFNKKPSDLLRAVMHREEAMFAERPGVLEIYSDLDQRTDDLRSTGLALVAGGDTWVLPFYAVDHYPVFPLPKATDTTLHNLAAVRGGRLHVLTLARPDITPQGPSLTLLRRYSEADSALYLLVVPPTK
jgi:hypothetical protein